MIDYVAAVLWRLVYVPALLAGVMGVDALGHAAETFHDPRWAWLRAALAVAVVIAGSLAILCQTLEGRRR